MGGGWLSIRAFSEGAWLMPAGYYAHSLEGRPPSEWEPLEEHLRRVAEMAEEFAGRFGAAEWGWVAG